MSTTIENNVVSMSFENSNFERNAKTTMSTLDKLRKALDFSGTANSLNEVSNAANQIDMSTLQNGVQEVHNRFSALEVVAITVLSRITNAAIDTGVRVTKALTLDSVMSGFGEYELMMNSVQTIMSGTGESLDTVMNKLNELNQYADDTIYVFSDMTQNIGKFTNAGVKLDTAVAAMKGLSNEAALAGANATEASRAMYNIAQSLSMGYMQYIDWKSIENANMATKDFKENLVETALELGTLNEAAVKAQPSINALFKDKLKDGWLTNDVLLTTLEKYSDETTELGKKAYAAAQDIKTFSQMWDTLTEAAGSGWSQTFGYIIGDFEQAKKLWTGVGNYFGDIIQKSAEARNSLFKTWNETGGRTYVINGLIEMFSSLRKTIGNVNLAFHDIFKGIDSSQLHDLSTSFYYFAKNLNDSLAPVAKDIRHTFDGLFSVLHIGVNIVTSIGRAFAYLLGNSGLGGLGSSILGVTGNFGLYLKRLDESITKNDTFFKILKKVADVLLLIPKGFNAAFTAITGTGFSEAIGNTASNLGNLVDLLHKFYDTVSSNIGSKIEALKESFRGLGTETGILEIIFTGAADGLSKIASVILDIVTAIGQAITTTFGKTDTSNMMDFINTAGLAGALSAFLLQLKNLMDPLDDIGDMITNIREDLAILQVAVKADAILKIAEALALMAASCLLLASVDADKLAAPMIVITTSMTELMAAFTVMEKLRGDSNNFFGSLRGLMDSFAQVQAANMLMRLSASVLIMAAALKVLSTIEPDRLAISLGAITALLADLVGASVFLDKFGGRISTGGFILMATGLLIISKAVKSIASVDPERLGESILSVTILLADLTAALTALSFMKSGPMMAGAASMMVISEALLLLTGVVKLMGSIDTATLTKGLLGIFGTLLLVTTALTGLSFLNPSGMIVGAIALTIASGAIATLAGALNKMASLSSGGLGTSLLAMFASLTMLSVALLAVRTALPGAFALIIAAGAINVLAESLLILSLVPFGTMMLTLLSLAIVIGGLAAASLLLGPIIPLMLSLSGTLAVFGAACLAVGGGIALLAAGLAMLAVSGVAGATAIVGIVSVILGAIPMIVNAIALFFEALIRAYINLLPLIIQAVMLTVQEICKALIEYRTFISETVVQLILGILNVLKEYTPQIVVAGVDIIVALINGIADKIPEVIDAIFNLVIAIIDGLGQAIEDHADDIRDAINRFGKHIWNAFCEFFGIHSPSKKFKEGGKFLIQGLINGIGGMVNAVKEKIGSLGKAMVDKFNEKKESFKSVGSNFMAGLRDGIESMRNAVVSKASDIAGSLLNRFRSLFDIHSPSRVTFGFGRFLDMGLINGMENLRSRVADKAANVANSVIEALTTNVPDVREEIDDAFNFNPVFKPVVDVSGIQNGVSAISRIFNDSIYDKASLLADIGEAKINSTIMANTVVSQNNRNIVDAINSLKQNINEASEKIASMQMVLDGKTIVGELAPAMDSALGTNAIRAGRRQ